MTVTARRPSKPRQIVRLPTEEDLPDSDGVPLESERHLRQMNLLIESLSLAWHHRQDFYVGGNMFLYFNGGQLRRASFRGPDVFVVLDVEKRERRSWVVWEEGRGPDLVIELLSPRTARFDRGEKKLIYQNQLRVPEYVWYHPFTGELAGFSLRGREYMPIEPDGAGRLISPSLGLALVPREGVYGGVEAAWLRWETLDGAVLPTEGEVAEQERNRADQERDRAEAAERRVAELEARLRAAEGPSV